MEQNLVALISNNVPPTDHEIQQIRHLLREGTAELAALDQDLSKTIAALADLMTLRSRRRGEVESLAAVLSPIRRIPPEILIEIFQHCMDTSIASATASIHSPSEAPVLLGQICRSWRTISQNAPRLWDRIAFQPRSESQDAYFLELVARAQEFPLSITLDIGKMFLPFGVSQPTLSPIWTLGPRIHELRLALDYRGVAVPMCGAEFPILTSLGIAVRSSTDVGQSAFEDAPDLVELLDIFHQAPNLHHLILVADYTPFTFRVPSQFGWNQLIALDIMVGISIVEVGDVLAQCTQLEMCQLDGIHPVDEDDMHPALCVLPNLRVFSLHVYIDGPTSHLLRRFSFPSLTHLDIHAFQWTMHDLLDLHARSIFPLQHLELSAYIPPSALIPFLGLLPTLERISFKRTIVQNSFFKAFTPDCAEFTSIDLPVLKTLCLEQHTEFLDGNIIVSMLESLWNPLQSAIRLLPRLERVELALQGSKFSPDVESRLAALNGSGFLVDSVERHTTERLWSS